MPIKKLCLLFVLLLAAGITRSDEVKLLGALAVNNRCDVPMGHELSNEINAGKKELDNPGTMVYFYLQNTSERPLALEDIVWQGRNSSQWSSAENSHRLIWSACRPRTIAPQEVAEIVLCLRDSLKQETEFELCFSGSLRVPVLATPRDPLFRLATLTFSPDLKRAYCYLERESGNAPLPGTVYHNGKAVPVRFLNTDYIDDTIIAIIDFPEPLCRGKRGTWIFTDADGNFVCGASLRAFSDLCGFGSYGYADFLRFARNGLGVFSSFTPVSREMLDEGVELGVKMFYGSPAEALPETTGHPAIYAYMIQDEPDCHDYFAWTERPVIERLGGYAPGLVDNCNQLELADPAVPTLLTINLTYTPYNYFVYGPLADIANPDIYTNTNNWDVKYVDHHLQTLKRAAGARPFTFTYQSSWEEVSTVPAGQWVGKAQLLTEGFDSYVDKSATPRGMGKPTTPAEVSIAMHYGIANGAVGLFGWWDATGAGGNLLFHGTDVIPANWAIVGENSQRFRNIASLLGIAHPMTLADCGDEKIYLKTLLAGDRAAIVVAINEHYSYFDGQLQTNFQKVVFSFPNTQLLAAKAVYRVEPQGFTLLDATQNAGVCRWEDELDAAAVYLLLPLEADIDDIAADAGIRRQVQEHGIIARQNRLQEKNSLRCKIEKEGEVIRGTGINAYLINSGIFANPDHTAHNAFEGYEHDGTTAMGATWNFTVASTEVAQKLQLMWHGRGTGAPVQFSVLDPGGSMVYEEVIKCDDYNYQIIEFIPESAGKWQLRAAVAPKDKCEHSYQSSIYIAVRSSERSIVQAREARISAAPKIPGTPEHGYYAVNAGFPDAAQGEYNVMEYWEASGQTAFSARFVLSVDSAALTRRHFIRWQAHSPQGLALDFRVLDAQGNEIYRRRAEDSLYRQYTEEVTFPATGNYSIIIEQSPPEKPIEHALWVGRSVRWLQE